MAQKRTRKRAPAPAKKRAGPSAATTSGTRRKTVGRPWLMQRLLVGYAVVVTVLLAALIATMPGGLNGWRTAIPSIDGRHDDGAGGAAPGTDDEIAAIIDTLDGELAIDLDTLPSILPIDRPPAWRRHAVTWRQDDGPRLAIVMDDLGLDRDASHRIAAMNGPLTLAFLPYADDLSRQTLPLRRAGHELLVHLPMEPHNPDADPGPNALLVGLDEGEFLRRLDWNLNRFDGFVGVNNHMGSRMTENPAKMVLVMSRLRRDGLLYLDSLTSPRTVGPRAARAVGVPSITRDVFLDNDRDRRAIRTQLKKAVRLAKQRGWAIAIGHPYPETLDVLERWTRARKPDGILLVPLSQLVNEAELRAGKQDRAGVAASR